jgi:AraC-like DNA-binding protein
MTQPSLKIVSPAGEFSFSARTAVKKHFHTLWHFHPECEIIYIEKSRGTCFAGDYIGRFKEGDVFMFGPFLPHFLRNDPDYYNEKSKLLAKATVLNFEEDFLGEKFLGLPELKKVSNLIKESRMGIMVPALHSKAIVKILSKIDPAKAEERILLLIAALSELASSKGLVFLTHSRYFTVSDPGKIERLNKVSDYLIKYYYKKITLQELADIACMSQTAFCRYFKSHTGKTFLEFLNEIRIGNACRMLAETDKSINEIAFLSGFFSNNFHQQFRKIKKMSPQEYQNNFR